MRHVEEEGSGADDRGRRLEIVVALLARVEEDRLSGRPRGIADYQREFPGHEELVARELAELLDPTTVTRDPGPPLGGFRLEAPLPGRDADLFQGRCARSGRSVVLKRLGRIRFDSLKEEERALRRAARAIRLEIPGVLPLLGAGAVNGVFWVAMPPVEGRSLDRIDDPERVRSALLDLVAGLARLHAEGLVHGDLRPERVMIEPDGRAVLLGAGEPRPDGASALEDVRAIARLLREVGADAGSPRRRRALDRALHPDPRRAPRDAGRLQRELAPRRWRIWPG
ncbi:MAG: hypothetical protein R3F20_00825 [Planctomycetota bacterium]